MQGDKQKRSPMTAVSKLMIESLERRERLPVFDLELLNKQLEEIDPGGREAMKSAIEMYNE
jgi:hypothetical protein